MASTTTSSNPRQMPSTAFSSSSGRIRKTSLARPPISSSASTSSNALPSSTTSSAYHGSSRRHSLFGTEDRVILDIGSRVSKFGFSGEARPRIILDSLLISRPPPSTLESYASTASTSSIASDDCLWDPNFEMCSSEAKRSEKEALLLARLTQLLRRAYTQHLMVDPKQRKVIIIENAFMPTIVKDTLCRILFSNLQVPSVSFIPLHLLGLVATGRLTGLVLDCGYLESSIVPIYYARPMVQLTRTTPRAGRRLSNRLKALLLAHGKYISPQSTFQGAHVSTRQRAGRIPKEYLTHDFLEEIKAKALVVGDPIEIQGEKLGKQGGTVAPQAPSPVIAGLPSALSGPGSIPNPFASQARTLPDVLRDFRNYDEAEDVDLMKRLKAEYSRHSQATDLAIRVPPQLAGDRNHGANGSGFGSTASNFGLGGGFIAIPGWVRERAAEVLFEEGDEDESSLVEMTLESIIKLPIDLRRPMIENVLITGGTAMLPGFITRFKLELVKRLEETERRCSDAASMLVSDCRPPRTNKKRKSRGERERENDETRSGTDPDAAEVEKLTNSYDTIMTRREDSGAEEGVKVRVKPPTSEEEGETKLSSNLFIINDPSPPPMDEEGKALQESGPAFPANLLGFIGGSLVGAMKTSSLSEINRETYEEEREAMVITTLPSNSVAFVDPSKAIGAGGSAATTTRPSLIGVGAGNRGSFVGVVGGLETGAFGGLAAVSRHLVGSSSNSSSVVVNPSTSSPISAHPSSGVRSSEFK
ncbi:actin-like ATPase domain-containing protein [Violaceomyces palustris]|uniref:Actin-like ATPase domain-containing protein n=1 Tax=Violaceomyces palustris TaxID=1673888 RepID=A0ACD0P354_9BASI|nr:actin-like ATPase domain-containing protein [Violaceomyces palustris]